MAKRFLKLHQLILLIPLFCMLMISGKCQHKEFKLSPSGDTLNIIDKNGLKQGKWVNTIGELRGEPGYDEEGYYKDNKKTGNWRKYNITGDLIAMENYRFGGKDGLQEYFNFLGNIEKHEEWRGFNPDAPYDTIPIYGSGNNEIIEFKIIKAEQYSVPHGEWKYYDQNGNITKFDTYDRGRLLVKNTPKPAPVVKAELDKPKEKTKEILDYEKKYSKKKRSQMEREGKTSL